MRLMCGFRRKRERLCMAAVAVLACICLAVFLCFVFLRDGGTTGNSSGTPGVGNSGVITTGSSSGIFSDPSIGFSFSVPDGYHAQKILSDSGETVIVQPATGSSGFQVFVIPFSDPGSSITAARVEKEARLTITHTASVTVASTAQGLSFIDNSSSPPLYDTWFAYNGYLYQAQTWASNAPLMENILASWQFK